jgi:hypothetical protein
MSIFMGVLPNVFLHPMRASVDRVIERVTGQLPAQVTAGPDVPEQPPQPRPSAPPARRASDSRVSNPGISSPPRSLVPSP